MKPIITWPRVVFAAVLLTGAVAASYFGTDTLVTQVTSLFGLL
jgi:hypothetical protein